MQRCRKLDATEACLVRYNNSLPSSQEMDFETKTVTRIGFSEYSDGRFAARQECASEAKQLSCHLLAQNCGVYTSHTRVHQMIMN